jgi:hypothetical protein
MARLSSKKLLMLAGELENDELAASQMGLIDAAKLMHAAKEIVVDALTKLEARRVRTRPKPRALPKAIIIPFPSRDGMAKQRSLRSRPPIGA